MQSVLPESIARDSNKGFYKTLSIPPVAKIEIEEKVLTAENKNSTVKVPIHVQNIAGEDSLVTSGCVERLTQTPLFSDQKSSEIEISIMLQIKNFPSLHQFLRALKKKLVKPKG